MAQFTVDDRIFKAKLTKMVKELKAGSYERRNLFQLMGIAGIQNIEDHFKKEAGPGGAWKPNSPATLKARAARSSVRAGNKYGPAILRDTGTMWRMNTQIKTGSVRVGSSADYAERHNFGRGVPQREWAYIDTPGHGKLKSNVAFYIKKITGFRLK